MVDCHCRSYSFSNYIQSFWFAANRLYFKRNASRDECDNRDMPIITCASLVHEFHDRSSPGKVSFTYNGNHCNCLLLRSLPVGIVYFYERLTICMYVSMHLLQSMHNTALERAGVRVIRTCANVRSVILLKTKQDFKQTSNLMWVLLYHKPSISILWSC